MQHQTVLIFDYGSQYAKLIARRIREFGVYCLIVSPEKELSQFEGLNVKAVILSGGPSSVYDEGAPSLPKNFITWIRSHKIPCLGICYGMQLLVHVFKGEVKRGTLREYGKMQIQWEDGKSQNVWMSHGDKIEKLPHGFKQTASSVQGIIAAMEYESDKIRGYQFHPEVTHTEGGDLLLKDFLFNLANISPDWKMEDVKTEQIQKIKNQVGPSDHVICALSGGVDSAVAAVLVHQAIGDRLHCVFVDHGLLRLKEQERVMKLFKDDLKLPVTCVSAQQLFLSRLKGVSDPEQKRKIIGKSFIDVFKDEAKKLETTLKQKPKFLVQGTLYPDVIESSPVQIGFKTFSATIKSHHNVGGLPEELGFDLIEPLRELFKDEVRALGKSLKVPESFLKRHPFPGPGLAVRILGEISLSTIEILQNADEVFIKALHEECLYDKIWQAFCVFLPIKTVGVQGDGRTHDYVIALRAVNSHDGMTAEWFPFESDFLRRVSTKICNEIKGVNRVVYDISSKPPATIEWE